MIVVAEVLYSRIFYHDHENGPDSWLLGVAGGLAVAGVGAASAPVRLG
jgi:hypothetical protein